MSDTTKQDGSDSLDEMVGYPMLINKEMAPVFVIAENMANAIEVIEATGVTEWEFQHSTSYRVIANSMDEGC